MSIFNFPKKVSPKNMFTKILTATCRIVTNFAYIRRLGFFGIFHFKMFYKYRTEKIPKYFFSQNNKILSSQTENYIFGDQTIKFNYAAKTCILGKLFWQIRFWTFINVHFSFSQKTFQRKNKTF